MGANMKLTVAAPHRERVRAVFTDALGAELQTPRPDLDVFRLGDGFVIGVYFPPTGGLTETQAREDGVWLELAVDDVAQTTRALAAHGVAPFDYPIDAGHPYFVLPGGCVFRLAEPPAQ